eukprot:GDKK01051729.1.p1 GENE.GDKK01051729.1~~GDKK01051729.1.p1  ORF type:complete len:612 (+),score=144.18 GDKK01051729.1:35-1837(+)
MSSTMQLIALTLATGVSMVSGSKSVTASCVDGMEVDLPGLQNQKVQYCSRSYDMNNLRNRVENGELLTYYYQRPDIHPINYNRDVADDYSFMTMSCLANQNVLPISAWFEYRNGVFEEDLSRVLNVKGSQDARNKYERFCTGNTISCVRAWSEIFPLRRDGDVAPFTTLVKDLEKVEALHLEWMCVPASTRDTFYPLVTFSDLSYSASVESTDFDQVDSVLSRPLVDPTNGKEKELGERSIVLDTHALCPAGTLYVEPVMVIDGANCASDVSVDLTSNGRNFCESTFKKIDGFSPVCKFPLPPQIPDGQGATRVPGCNRRRASGIGRCVLEDKYIRLAYAKMREFAAAKSAEGGARMIQYTPTDAHGYITCTFMNPFYFKKPFEAFTSREVCCFMESLGINGCHHDGNDILAVVPAYVATEGDADSAKRGDTLASFIVKNSGIQFRCIQEPFIDHAKSLKDRADSASKFGEINVAALESIHKNVMTEKKTLVDIFGDFHDLNSTTTTTPSPLDNGSVDETLGKMNAFFHYALKTNSELTYCVIRKAPQSFNAVPPTKDESGESTTIAPPSNATKSVNAEGAAASEDDSEDSEDSEKQVKK